MDWLVDMLKQHTGAVAGGGGLLTIIAVRFLPPLLAAWRERRLEILKERLSEKTEYTTREHELFARLDRKDSVLEKLTGNHIQHLEIQLAQGREFHAKAIEALTGLSRNQESIARELAEIRRDAEEIKEDTTFLRGRLS